MIWKMLMACVCLIPTGVPSQDVKHAPTLESCVADINLWSSEIPGEWPATTWEQWRKGTEPLTVHELEGRMVALSECIQSYPRLAHSKPDEIAAPQMLIDMYGLEIKERLEHFLDRHGLQEKFAGEDKAGKR